MPGGIVSSFEESYAGWFPGHLPNCRLTLERRSLATQLDSPLGTNGSDYRFIDLGLGKCSDCKVD